MAGVPGALSKTQKEGGDREDHDGKGKRICLEVLWEAVR